MKNSAILLLLLLSNVTLLAQKDAGSRKKLNWQPPTSSPAVTETSTGSKKMSVKTSFLLLDYNAHLKNPEALTEQDLIDKYILIKKDNTLYANSFIVINDNFKVETAERLGVLMNITVGSLNTALIPVKEIQNVAALNGVKYIQIGKKAYPRMDSARVVTNVDLVHQGASPLNSPYTGKDVVVGVLDFGFDLTHPNFYDTTGTNNYRVKRAWFQGDGRGTPPTGYSYGSEYTTMTTMLNAGTDDTTGTHATHVAGIAAGSGGYPGSPYKGVATESDLVFVGLSGASIDIAVANGIEYVQNYAASVGKPCVINMSLGQHEGPHDGTSALDQFIDSRATPGNLIVGAAGNENGSIPFYLGNNYNTTDTILQTFISSYMQTNDISGGVDIWGDKNENFKVEIAVYNVINNIVEDRTVFLSTTADSSFTDTLYGTNNIPVIVAMGAEISDLNNKPHIQLQFDNSGQQSIDRFILLSIIGHNTSTKMWVMPETTTGFYNFGYGGSVKQGNSTHSVGEIGGTAKKIITVGAYTTKTQWTDLSNNTQNSTSYGSVGEIASFSSLGPTADGRTKPDITAPGNILASSFNSYDVSIDQHADRLVDSINVGGQDYHYYMSEGTSMATPMVTGILALWLEEYPELTVEQVFAIFEETAITDNFTGNIPYLGSNIWGWGKIDALVGLDTIIKNIPATPTNNMLSLCEGGDHTLVADAGFAGYQWTNGDTTQTVTVAASGEYAYRVKNSNDFYSDWSDTTVIHTPKAVSIISVFGNTMTSSSASSYQWYKDNNPIAGATAQSYTAVSSGIYYVSITDDNNCSNESAPMFLATSGIHSIQQEGSIYAYPNPATNTVTLKGLHGNTSYDVINQQGSVVQKGMTDVSDATIDISTLAAGVYMVNLANSDYNGTLKFIKK